VSVRGIMESSSRSPSVDRPESAGQVTRIRPPPGRNRERSLMDTTRNQARPPSARASHRSTTPRTRTRVPSWAPRDRARSGGMAIGRPKATNPTRATRHHAVARLDRDRPIPTMRQPARSDAMSSAPSNDGASGPTTGVRRRWSAATMPRAKGTTARSGAGIRECATSKPFRTGRPEGRFREGTEAMGRTGSRAARRVFDYTSKPVGPDLEAGQRFEVSAVAATTCEDEASSGGTTTCAMPPGARSIWTPQRTLSPSRNDN